MKNNYTKSNITIYDLKSNIITVTYYLQKSNLVILLFTHKVIILRNLSYK